MVYYAAAVVVVVDDVIIHYYYQQGPIIIIIDGVHRMRDERGEEDLKWLPLSFPGNVRVIVSTTVYKDEGCSGTSSTGGGSKRNRA